MSVLLYAILLFFLYNFIVKVVLPVYRTTRQIKRQFSGMKQQFQQSGSAAPPEPEPAASRKKDKPKIGEYIDFEEVK